MNTVTGRFGPFWDAVEGRTPVPRAAATLGFEFIRADVEKGVIELAFTALEASLTDKGGAPIATATAIARVIPLAQAETAV